MSQENYAIALPQIGVDIMAMTIISKEKMSEIFLRRLARMTGFAIKILKSNPDYQQSFARYDYKSWKTFNTNPDKAMLTLHKISDMIEIMPEVKAINFDKSYYIEYFLGNDRIAVCARKDGVLAMSNVDNCKYEEMRPDADEEFVEQSGRRLMMR